MTRTEEIEEAITQTKILIKRPTLNEFSRKSWLKHILSVLEKFKRVEEARSIQAIFPEELVLEKEE